LAADGNYYAITRTAYTFGTRPSNAFHVWNILTTDGMTIGAGADGAVVTAVGTPLSNLGDFDCIGQRGTTGVGAGVSDGDIAEIVFYTALPPEIPAGGPGVGRLQLQQGLAQKYGISIPDGATPAQPNDPSVLSILGSWWKADSLL
jgi:hypothetical protein